MALPKSGKSGSNVLKLDDVRRKRANSTQPEKQESPEVTDANQKAKPNGNTKSPASASPKRRRTDQAEPVKSKSSEDPKNNAAKTPAKRPRVSNRRFDKVKVERIKSELSRGEYQINFLQVADKFIEHERYS